MLDSSIISSIFLGTFFLNFKYSLLLANFIKYFEISLNFISLLRNLFTKISFDSN